MTKYEEILTEDYSQRLFHQFLYTTALNNRMPFRVLQFDIDDTDSVIVIFSHTARGTVTTKQIKLEKTEMLFFLHWLGTEFPDIDFEKAESDYGEN